MGQLLRLRQDQVAREPKLTDQNYNHFTGVDYDAKTETKAIYMVGVVPESKRDRADEADPGRRQELGDGRGQGKWIVRLPDVCECRRLVVMMDRERRADNAGGQ
jgi:hypothetical protein